MRDPPLQSVVLWSARPNISDARVEQRAHAWGSGCQRDLEETVTPLIFYRLNPFIAHFFIWTNYSQLPDSYQERQESFIQTLRSLPCHHSLCDHQRWKRCSTQWKSALWQVNILHSNEQKSVSVVYTACHQALSDAQTILKHVTIFWRLKSELGRWHDLIWSILELFHIHLPGLWANGSLC